MTERLFRDGGAGAIYRVHLAPCEHARGIDPDVQAVVFEEISSGQVRCARLYRGWSLDELSDRDLRRLLDEAT